VFAAVRRQTGVLRRRCGHEDLAFLRGRFNSPRAAPTAPPAKPDARERGGCRARRFDRVQRGATRSAALVVKLPGPVSRRRCGCRSSFERFCDAGPGRAVSPRARRLDILDRDHERVRHRRLDDRADDRHDRDAAHHRRRAKAWLAGHLDGAHAGWARAGRQHDLHGVLAHRRFAVDTVRQQLLVVRRLSR